MIAVQHNGRIAVAADSLWVSGMDGSQCVVPKIHRRGDTIVTVGPSCGWSTALRRQVLAIIDKHDDWPEYWPEYCLGQENDHVITRLQDNTDAPVLVVWRGRVFQVWASGALFERADNVTAIGCGGNFAKGAALALLPRYTTARTVAITAAEIACELSVGCAPPIICETVADAKEGEA